MKKVRRRVAALAMSTSRSSVAMRSAPTDQVHLFCQMMLVCRSIAPPMRKLRASKACRSTWDAATCAVST
jgi:hypothetical protein